MIADILRVGSLLNAQQKSGFTPLHEAVERGHESVAAWLMQTGADLNVRSKKGQTPLHTSAGMGRIEMASLLLQYGADVNVRDNNGLCCFDYTNDDTLKNLLLGFSVEYLMDLGDVWDCGKTEVVKSISLFKSFSSLSLDGADLELEHLCQLFSPLDESKCASFVSHIMQVVRVPTYNPTQESTLMGERTYFWGSCDFCQVLRYMLFSVSFQRINSE